AIEAEKVRRIRNGAHAREKAQQVFVKAPDVLDNILSDRSASPRHRIEAAREIRAVAATGPEATPAGDRFVIPINLGEVYKLRIVKPIAGGPIDETGQSIDVTPQGLLPIIAAKNREGNGGGEPI